MPTPPRAAPITAPQGQRGHVSLPGVLPPGRSMPVPGDSGERSQWGGHTPHPPSAFADGGTKPMTGAVAPMTGAIAPMTGAIVPMTW